MSDTPPYSEATVELVARASSEFGPAGREMWATTSAASREIYLSEARFILAALAAAGRLLPEGAIREHAVRYLNTGTVTHPVSSAESARLISKAWRDDEGIECEPVERLVGPWSAVPPEPKEGT